MAGRLPKEQTSRPRDAKRRVHGDPKQAEGVGWQHGDVPSPPEGLMDASLEAWQVWFRAWWAAHWGPEDLPMLRQLIGLFDKEQRHELNAAGINQYRQLLESYGITPKGAMSLRWKKPEKVLDAEKGPSTSQYGHLKAVE